MVESESFRGHKQHSSHCHLCVPNPHIFIPPKMKHSDLDEKYTVLSNTFIQINADQSSPHSALELDVHSHVDVIFASVSQYRNKLLTNVQIKNQPNCFLAPCSFESNSASLSSHSHPASTLPPHPQCPTNPIHVNARQPSGGRGLGDVHQGRGQCHSPRFWGWVQFSAAKKAGDWKGQRVGHA